MSRSSNRVVLRVGLIAAVLVAATTAFAAVKRDSAAGQKVQRLLYVTVPDGAGGTRGRGILIFDIDNGYKLLRQIDIPDIGGTRGVCASAETNKLYYSHSRNKLACMDLITEKKLWENEYDKSQGGCDRMVIMPNGKKLYVPSGWWGDHPYWKVVDGDTGKLITMVEVAPGAHDTICSLDGKRVYCGSTKFNMFTIIDTDTDTVLRQVGPFSGVIYPFSINGSETLGFINVDHFVGFEIGDLRTGKKLHHVRVKGMEDQRRRCHGIGITPDETEIWLVDQDIKRLWIFDATVMPPKQKGHIDISAKTHGWITFSLDGRHAYPDTGDIIDVKSKKIIATLEDANGDRVISSKFVEIHFINGDPVRVGTQQAVGRVTGTAAGP